MTHNFNDKQQPLPYRMRRHRKEHERIETGVVKGIRQGFLRPVQGPAPFGLPIFRQVPHVRHGPLTNVIRVRQGMIAGPVITGRATDGGRMTIATGQVRHERAGGVGFENVAAQILTEGRKVVLVVNIKVPIMVAVRLVVFVVVPMIRGRQDRMHGLGQFRDKGVLENDHFARSQSRLEVGEDGGIAIAGIQNVLNRFGFRDEGQRGFGGCSGGG